MTIKSIIEDWFDSFSLRFNRERYTATVALYHGALYHRPSSGPKPPASAGWDRHAMARAQEARYNRSKAA